LGKGERRNPEKKFTSLKNERGQDVEGKAFGRWKDLVLGNRKTRKNANRPNVGT